MDVFIPRDVIGDVSVCHLTQVIACMRPRCHGLFEDPTSLSPLQKVFSNINFFCGSKAEGLSGYSIIVDGRKTIADIDILIGMKCPCKIGPRDDPETHVIIDTSDTKPGYLRLEHIPRVPHEKCNSFKSECGIDKSTGAGQSRTYIQNKRYVMFLKMCLDLIYGSGPPIVVKYLMNAFGLPAVCPEADYLIDILKQNKEFITTNAGPAVNYHTLNDQSPTTTDIAAAPINELRRMFENKLIQGFSLDATCAFKCDFWPSAAEEWLTRDRPSGWLSSDMIQDIRDHGCYFVQVPHWESLDPDIEWRYSFTYGEKKLAHYLTEVQRDCFIVFKTAIKALLHPNTAVSSYCLKNILFWTLDRIPTDVWENPWTGLGTCFLALLDELIQCLASHNLPQYFIPANNLIGHKPREMIKIGLERMVQIRRNTVCELLEFDEKYPPTFHINWEKLREVCGAFLKTGFGRRLFVDFKDDFLNLCIRRLCLLAESTREMQVGVTKIFSRILSYAQSLAGSSVLFGQLNEVYVNNEFHELAIRTHLNYTWYCFIHMCHNESQPQNDEKLSLVLQTFSVIENPQLGEVMSLNLKVFCYTRLSIMLHKMECYHEALNAAEHLLCLSSSLPELCPPADYSDSDESVQLAHNNVATSPFDEPEGSNENVGFDDLDESVQLPRNVLRVSPHGQSQIMTLWRRCLNVLCPLNEDLDESGDSESDESFHFNSDNLDECGDSESDESFHFNSDNLDESGDSESDESFRFNSDNLHAMFNPIVESKIWSDGCFQMVNVMISCCVLYSKHSSVGFHSSLQSLPNSEVESLLISPICIAYHTLFQCYLDSNMADEALDVLCLFKDYCQRLKNVKPDLTRAQIRSPAMFILAQDQQKIGDHSGAIATFKSLQEMPLSRFVLDCDSALLAATQSHA